MRLAHVPMKSILVVAVITAARHCRFHLAGNMPWPAGNAPSAFGFHAMKAVVGLFLRMGELARAPSALRILILNVGHERKSRARKHLSVKSPELLQGCDGSACPGGMRSL
jgi:hypothetical protein